MLTLVLPCCAASRICLKRERSAALFAQHDEMGEAAELHPMSVAFSLLLASLKRSLTQSHISAAPILEEKCLNKRIMDPEPSKSKPCASNTAR